MLTKDRTNSPVPEKHFLKWLQTESRLAALNMWIGLVKFVLTLSAVTGLTIYLSNRPPESLKYLLPVIGFIGTLAGLYKYKTKNRHVDS